MDNLISTAFPDPKNVSPAVMQNPIVENVPEGNYLNRILNFAKAPPHYKSIYPNHCTTLPPSPKNHLTNDPACVKCNIRYSNQPFAEDKCYMLYSPEQNIWGPVCGSGGSNANWARGNDFAVDYDYDKMYKRDEYEVKVPKLVKENPTLVANSPFYPFPDYNVRFDPKYGSYPYINNYIDGQPTIRYPHLTIENFENSGQNVLTVFMNLMIILIILFLVRRYML